MLIALDYDNTYSLDAEIWELFVPLAKLKNHCWVCVTSRSYSDDNAKLKQTIGKLMPVVYCNGKPKAKVAQKKGYKPDVWIDDKPHNIGEFH